MEERTQQLLLFQRSIGVLPQSSSSSDDWNALKSQTLKNVDLAKRLEDATMALQVMEESKAALERRLQNSSSWKDELDQPTRPQWRTMDDVARARSREASPLRTLPSRLRERTGSVSSLASLARSETDSNGSDDFAQRKHTQNLKNEIEDLTTRLELSEMQRRRLELRTTPTHSRQNSTDSEVLEIRRLQRRQSLAATGNRRAGLGARAARRLHRPLRRDPRRGRRALAAWIHRIDNSSQYARHRYSCFQCRCDAFGRDPGQDESAFLQILGAE